MNNKRRRRQSDMEDYFPRGELKMRLQMNLCLGVFGLSLVILGAVGVAFPPRVSEIIEGAPEGTTPALALGFGLGFLALSCLGIGISITESKRLMYAYIGTFVLVTIGLTIIFYVSLTALMHSKSGRYKEGVVSLLKHYTPRNKRRIDEINRKFECCGLDGFESWPELGAVNYTDSVVGKVMPASCCTGTTHEDDLNGVNCTRFQATHVSCVRQLDAEYFLLSLYSFSTSITLLAYLTFVAFCSFYMITVK